MKRRGFLKRFATGVAVATVAPVAIASAIPREGLGYAADYCASKQFISVRYGGRTYHFLKGILNTEERWMKEASVLPFKEMRMMIPDGKDMVSINFKKS